jgi:hypothetical protein
VHVVLLQIPTIPESRPQELVPSGHALRQGWPGTVHRLGGRTSPRAKLDAPKTTSNGKSATDRVFNDSSGAWDASAGCTKRTRPRARLPCRRRSAGALHRSAQFLRLAAQELRLSRAYSLSSRAGPSFARHESGDVPADG